MNHMEHVYDDGGRKAAGFKGHARDCVARSVAIASGRDYAEVYAALADITAGLSKTKRRRAKLVGRRSARNGVYTKSKAFRDYMAKLGFTWTPTMHIGSGCKVHLVEGELPMGRLVVAVSGHYTAVIDGEVHDTFDPQRTTFNSTPGVSGWTRSERCVYGYWTFTGIAR